MNHWQNFYHDATAEELDRVRNLYLAMPDYAENIMSALVSARAI